MRKLFGRCGGQAQEVAWERTASMKDLGWMR
jgi:hypothetical protein